jgi:hypothetical protein
MLGEPTGENLSGNENKIAIPEDLFEDDLDPEDSEYSGHEERKLASIAPKIAEFLDKSESPEEWDKKIEKILYTLNEITGGYEEGLLSQKTLLTNLLRLKFNTKNKE